MFGFDLAAADVDGVLGDELSFAADEVDLVLAEEEFEALDDAGDDLAAAVDGGTVVGFEAVEGDAEGLGVFEGADDLGVAQKGLGGDAADVEADAADPLALDDRSLKAVLGGAKGSDIAAWAGADDDHVVGTG